MEQYTPGKPVAVTFVLASESGEALTPTAVRSRILDENDTVLQDWADVIDFADTVVITVLGALNILTPPAQRGARVVELEVTTDSGTLQFSESFLLQGPTALTFGINTFQTYAAANVYAADFVPLQLAGWHAASRDEQEKALIEAHGRILRLPIAFERDSDQSVDGEWAGLFGMPMLRDLTPTQINALKPGMLKALRAAQLVEASEILQGDPVRAARASGLLSNTNGESSQFFRTAKPLELPVSPRALEFVQRWVRFGASIGRR